VAVKMLGFAIDQAHFQATAVAKAMLHQEAFIMCQLHHPCVARVFGLVDEGEKQVGWVG
jgi:hypothetical protein